MKKLLLHCLVALFCASTLIFNAWAADYSSTIIIGTGATKDEAIQDAIRNAVEAATGVFVYSSTEVKDYTLVKDKIVTASKGYVKDFQVLSESKNDGIHFVKLKVAVDMANIKAVIKRELKTVTYEDALKDYAALTSLVERNKKYAEILKSISSRPTNELYRIDYIGYEIIDAGTQSADVVLKFRIAPNTYLWDTYYDVLRQIGSKQGRNEDSNHIIINYRIVKEYPWGFDIKGERFYLHKDFNDVIIKPRWVFIAYTLTGSRSGWRLKSFDIYDRYINNREYLRSEWVHVNETVKKNVEESAVGYFMGHDGFEFKVHRTFNNIEDIKKLPYIKVTLEDVDAAAKARRARMDSAYNSHYKWE